ncbi:MAG: N-acetyltransferase [Erysipelotrichaceae bacterium]|nr:N-acetyltransferase [Erysipelotrichaceae bacterium]
MKYTYVLQEAEKKIVVNFENEVIGIIAWKDEGGNVINAYSTYVDPAHRGGKIALTLVEKLVNFAKENGLKIKPTCSYVVRLFEREEKYQEVQV